MIALQSGTRRWEERSRFWISILRSGGFFLVTWCHWRCLDWEQLSTGRRQCVKSTNIFFILTKWCLGVRQDRLKVFNPQKKSALPAFEETHRRLKKHQDLSNEEGAFFSQFYLFFWPRFSFFHNLIFFFDQDFHIRWIPDVAAWQRLYLPQAPIPDSQGKR